MKFSELGIGKMFVVIGDEDWGHTKTNDTMATVYQTGVVWGPEDDEDVKEVEPIQWKCYE